MYLFVYQCNEWWWSLYNYKLKKNDWRYQITTILSFLLLLLLSRRAYRTEYAFLCYIREREKNILKWYFKKMHKRSEPKRCCISNCRKVSKCLCRRMNGGEEQNKERQHMRTNEREKTKKRRDISHVEEGFIKVMACFSFFFSLSLVFFSVYYSSSSSSASSFSPLLRSLYHHHHHRAISLAHQIITDTWWVDIIFTIRETKTSNLYSSTTRGDMSKINISTRDIAKRNEDILLEEMKFRRRTDGNLYPIAEIFY